MVKTCLSLWQNIQFLVLTKIYLWALTNQSHFLFLYRVIWIRTNLFVRGGGGGGVPSFLFRPRGCCCCGSCCCCCCCCCCRDVTWWWCAGRLTGPNRLVSTSPSLSLSSPSLSSSSSSCSSLAAFQSYNWKICVAKILYCLGNSRPLLFIWALHKQLLHNKNYWLQPDPNSDRWSRRRACWPLDHHLSPVKEIILLCNVFLLL